MPLSVRLAGAATLVAVLASPGAAQRPHTTPSIWAITGATIEPVSGRSIANGTIVIRNGLIEAVGANVKAPADARIVDGSGMTVYPGFIDAYTSLGMPAANAGGRNAGGQSATRPEAPNSNYRAGMQAEMRAVDVLDPADNAFKSAREAGFTAALTGQSSGIFRGTSALISLGNGSVNNLVIADGLTQNLGYSNGRGGGFPGSLMGVFAQLRQEFLDAAHYRDVRAAYQRNPLGKSRPEYDPTMEALQSVISGKEAVVFPASSLREIRRSLALAKEFGLTPIIAGGTESAQVAKELAAARVPVLLEIDFPRKTATGGAAGGRGGGRGAAAGDDTPESMRVLRDRVERPKVAGKLAQAGVSFAMTSGNAYGEFVANLRHAVAAGLPKDDALKAITLVPARLFGVDDRLGTIEAGKIANLTLVTGDLFAEGGKISQLFVDGEQFDFSAPDTAADSSAAPAGRRIQ